MGKGKGNFKNPITNTCNSLPLNEHKQFYYQIDAETDRAPVYRGSNSKLSLFLKEGILIIPLCQRRI